MKDPQPPTVSSSPPVGEGRYGWMETRLLVGEVWVRREEAESHFDAFVEGQDERCHDLETKGKALCQQNGALLMEADDLAKRLKRSSDTLFQCVSDRDAAQAREQRLLTAFDGLIKELDTAEARARDERWNSAADAYKYAAEWAQAALEKGRGGG